MVGGRGLTPAEARGTGSHKKVLTDAEVELVRELHEEWGHSYRSLAEKFEVSKSHIRDLVVFRRRA